MQTLKKRLIVYRDISSLKSYCHNITGNMYNCIKNMYTNDLACINVVCVCVCVCVWGGGGDNGKFLHEQRSQTRVHFESTTIQYFPVGSTNVPREYW